MNCSICDRIAAMCQGCFSYQEKKKPSTLPKYDKEGRLIVASGEDATFYEDIAKEYEDQRAKVLA